jgi:hypothetical protein
MTPSLLPDSARAPVVLTDCPFCLSAGSARRGVCDICGAAVPVVAPDAGPDSSQLLPA